MVVMLMICCSARADWHKHEVKAKGIKLHQMTKKQFNLTYCAKRAYTRLRYLTPMPTCNDEQVTQVH